VLDFFKTLAMFVSRQAATAALKVAEEVPWRMKFIDDDAFNRLIDPRPLAKY
jgi:hypothetical protein